MYDASVAGGRGRLAWGMALSIQAQLGGDDEREEEGEEDDEAVGNEEGGGHPTRQPPMPPPLRRPNNHIDDTGFLTSELPHRVRRLGHGKQHTVLEIDLPQDMAQLQVQREENKTLKRDRLEEIF